MGNKAEVDIILFLKLRWWIEVGGNEYEFQILLSLKPLSGENQVNISL